MTFSRIILVCALAAALSLVVMPAEAVFKCTDDKGQTHYGDTMPPQCAKRDVVEYGKGGDVVRKIDAPLTTDQLRLREEAAQKRSEEQRLIREQKQKDFALIGTYGSEREFDQSRDSDVKELDARKRILTTRIGEVEKLLEKFNADMDFYRPSKSGKGKVKEPPPQLVSDIGHATADIASLNKLIARIEEEKQTIIAKTDAEKSRWKRLKAGMPPGTLVDAKGSQVTPVKTAAPEKRAAASKTTKTQ